MHVALQSLEEHRACAGSSVHIDGINEQMKPQALGSVFPVFFFPVCGSSIKGLEICQSELRGERTFLYYLASQLQNKDLNLEHLLLTGRF